MHVAKAPADSKTRDPAELVGARVPLEQKVVGWLLKREPAIEGQLAAVREIAPNFQAPHDRIVAAIGKAFDTALEVSPTSISLRMGRDDGLAELGGIDYLLKLCDAAPVILKPQEAERAIRTWRAFHTREQIIARTEHLVAAVSEDAPDASEQVAILQRLLVQSDTVRGPRIQIIPFDEIILSPRARYLVAGLIPRIGLAVVWGPPKSGKSFWAFDLVMHVALGWEYRGRRVEQGSVVYCAFEGQAGVEARVAAFRQRFLVGRQDPVPFYLEPVRLNLVADHRALIAAIERQLTPGQPPVAVVLDTLNRSLPGSESNDEDMSAYVNAADAVIEAFGCAVIIVHHCGVEATRPRGHTSLTGAADVQESVKRDAADNIIVEVELAKDGPQGDKIVSRLEVVEVGQDEHGETITSCVIVPSDDIPAGRKVRLTGATTVALDLLRKAIIEAPEQAPATPHVPRDIGTTTVAMWRTYFYQGTADENDKRDTQKKAFHRASLKLQSLGVIGIWGEFVWIN